MGSRAGLGVLETRKSLTSARLEPRFFNRPQQLLPNPVTHSLKLYFINLRFVKGADSSVGIKSRLRRTRLGNPGSIIGRESVQTGYLIKPASFSIGKVSSFHGRKALGASRTCVYSRSWERKELYLHSTTFLHGVQWNITFSPFHRTMFSAYLRLYSARRWIKKPGKDLEKFGDFFSPI